MHMKKHRVQLFNIVQFISIFILYRHNKGFGKPELQNAELQTVTELRIMTSFPELLTLEFLRFLFSRVTNSR